MNSRLLSVGFVVLGIALLSVAAYDLLTPADGPGVAIEEPEREVTDCSAGKAREVTFPVHNRTGRPLQVLGLTEC